MWHARFPIEWGHGNRQRGRWSLALATLTAAVVWLTILPLVGQLPVVRDTIRRNERLGVDPAAKFYTELPCMPGVFERVQQSMRRHHDRVASH